MKFSELHTLAQDFTVLYVEDDDSIRTLTSKVLESLFKKVHLAANGQEGLAFFKNHTVDVVITDIHMPQMDGLEMIEKIREIDAFVPIIITSAFNNDEYFLRSIDLRVDRYVIKPISLKQFENAATFVAQMLFDRKSTKELEERKIQERINQNSKFITAQIADSYQNPCLIVKNGTIVFINKSFYTLIPQQQIEALLDKDITKVELFDQKAGFLTKLSELNEAKPSENKVSISRKHFRKIYKIKKENITLDTNEHSTIYTFQDITLEEYQKIKISNYVSMLENFIFKKRFSALQTEEQKGVPPLETSQIEKEKLHVSDEQKGVLRKSHTHKTTALEYVSELDTETLQELQELDELDNELKEHIETFIAEENKTSILGISEKLALYSKEINLLFEFKDLGYAIESLANILSTIDETVIQTKGAKNIAVILQGIQSDLADWRKVIFVEQSAIDIHYLDSSLFSAALQIELLFNCENLDVQDDEDDFELF